VLLNLPPQIVLGSGREVPPSVAASGSVRVAAIKLADDRSGDLVIRLHEAPGRRERTTLKFADDIVRATRTDLHETPVGRSLPTDNGRIGLELNPFEIVTLRAEIG
jgi:alpha-mannosidase